MKKTYACTLVLVTTFTAHLRCMEPTAAKASGMAIGFAAAPAACKPSPLSPSTPPHAFGQIPSPVTDTSNLPPSPIATPELPPRSPSSKIGSARTALLLREARGRLRIRGTVRRALRSFEIDPGTVKIKIEKLDCDGRQNPLTREIVINQIFGDPRMANDLEYLAYHIAAHRLQKIKEPGNTREREALQILTLMHLLQDKKYGAILRLMILPKLRNDVAEDECGRMVEYLGKAGYELKPIYKAERLATARQMLGCNYNPKFCLLLMKDGEIIDAVGMRTAPENPERLRPVPALTSVRLAIEKMHIKRKVRLEDYGTILEGLLALLENISDEKISREKRLADRVRLKTVIEYLDNIGYKIRFTYDLEKYWNSWHDDCRTVLLLLKQNNLLAIRTSKNFLKDSMAK